MISQLLVPLYLITPLLISMIIFIYSVKLKFNDGSTLTVRLLRFQKPIFLVNDQIFGNFL